MQTNVYANHLIKHVATFLPEYTDTETKSTFTLTVNKSPPCTGRLLILCCHSGGEFPVVRTGQTPWIEFLKIKIAGWEFLDGIGVSFSGTLSTYIRGRGKHLLAILQLTHSPKVSINPPSKDFQSFLGR